MPSPGPEPKVPGGNGCLGVEAEAEVGLGWIIQGTGAGFDSLFLVTASLSGLT